MLPAPLNEIYLLCSKCEEYGGENLRKNSLSFAYSHCKVYTVSVSYSYGNEKGAAAVNGKLQ